MEPFVNMARPNVSTAGVLKMLTPEAMRGALGGFLRRQWASDAAVAESGLKQPLVEDDLFGFDGKDPATRKVRWEMRHVHFTLPERGIVAAIPEGLFVQGTLGPTWDGILEMFRVGQPQAQWGLIAATVEDQEIRRHEAVPQNYTAGSTASAAMAILAGAGREELEIEPSRKVVPVVDNNVVVQAVFVDLTRGDLMDPNGAFELARQGNAMQVYVDSGRSFRLMPMGMRKERDRARATVRRYLELMNATKVAEADALKASLAAVDPAAVLAMRTAGMSDGAIAATLRVPEAALVAAFPRPKEPR
jgi:hypothetical protein